MPGLNHYNALCVVVIAKSTNKICHALDASTSPSNCKTLLAVEVRNTENNVQ